MGRSEECAQELAPQSHIHSGLNQLDPTSSKFSKPTVTSTRTEDGGLGPPVKGVQLVFLWVIAIVFPTPGWLSLKHSDTSTAVLVDFAWRLILLAGWLACFFLGGGVFFSFIVLPLLCLSFLAVLHSAHLVMEIRIASNCL